MVNWIKLEREWVGKYIHHRNLLGKGRGELSWLTDALKIFGWIGALAAIDVVRTQIEWFYLSIIGYLAISYLIGWYWDKRHHFDLESEWGNERNPTIQDIKKKVSK